MGHCLKMGVPTKNGSVVSYVQCVCEEAYAARAKVCSKRARMAQCVLKTCLLQSVSLSNQAGRKVGVQVGSVCSKCVPQMVLKSCPSGCQMPPSSRRVHAGHTAVHVRNHSLLCMQAGRQKKGEEFMSVQPLPKKAETG